ncbi:WYL domain-containing protein [Nakamurella sp. YIM 132087]|uniref:WYL domain-containing protein n=1 Tax=Nakamurella alba TaxID=2665158 RepID=A0A7K1FLQ4_9ACTN|nr:WYL domain-containing protein [Nakamurella alba]MTD14163.1 WYL domain-containing protein [Nakamurella alba]
MPRPTARVLALLEILQGGRTHTVAELAERLGVDDRTVRRYVTHLLDLEVPVVTVRGRYGGYHLAPGFRIPPLMLTDDEALAVLLGLRAGRRSGTFPATVGEVATATEAKIRRVLPARTAARLDALLLVAHDTAAAAAPEVGTEVLLRLAGATHDRRPVRIRHTRRDGSATDRTLHPHGLVAHRGHWYVTGVDPDLDEQRTFRVDRIDRVSLQDGTFDPPDDADPVAAVLEALAATPWRYDVRVLARLPAADLLARLPAGLATVRELPSRPGWSRIRLRAEQLDWLPGLLLGLGAEVVVERPAELRAEVRAAGERLLAAAGGSDVTRFPVDEG